MNKFFIITVLCVLVLSCTKDVTTPHVLRDTNLKRLISNVSPNSSYEYYILPEDGDLSSIPQDDRNPLTPEKVALGKMLFHETGIAMDAQYASGMGTYSCSSCHIAEAGFRPGAAQGVADGGIGFGVNGENRIKNSEYTEDEIDVQSARPLALINVAYVTNTMWDGSFGSGGANVGTEELWHGDEGLERNALGYEGLETQNFEGMDTHRLRTNKEILDRHGYTELYDAVFADISEEERYSTFVTSLAISAYIRSIVANKAPFQDYLKGNSNALTDQEKLGAEMFFGKAACAGCHYKQNLGSNEFHRLGVKDMYQRPSFSSDRSDKRNLGRGGFTREEEDHYKFKVPQLYNLADAPFFFHGSSKHTIEDVVNYKIKAESENPNVETSILSEKFRPLTLTSDERDALIAFLRNGLRDPDLVRYKPTSVLSGNCFPNNDEQSRLDLGCY